MDQERFDQISRRMADASPGAWWHACGSACGQQSDEFHGGSQEEEPQAQQAESETWPKTVNCAQR
jgi:hypothetical protein